MAQIAKMILKKKHISKTLQEVKGAVLFGADTAMSPNRLVSPGEIVYVNTEYALPVQFTSPDNAALEQYNTKILQDVLETVLMNSLQPALVKMASVPGKPTQVNIGALVHAWEKHQQKFPDRNRDSGDKLSRIRTPTPLKRQRKGGLQQSASPSRINKYGKLRRKR